MRLGTIGRWGTGCVWHMACGLGTRCNRRTATPIHLHDQRRIFREPTNAAMGFCRTCFPLTPCVCDIPLRPIYGMCCRCDGRVEVVRSHGKMRQRRSEAVDISYHGDGYR